MIRTAVFLIGFTTIVSQMIVLREIFVLYQGMELSIGIILGLWLLWTAAGSLFGGRFFREKPPRLTVFGILLLLLGISIPFTITMIRYIHLHYLTVPGEMLGIFPLIVNTTVSLAFFCILSGGMFAYAGKLQSGRQFSETGPAVSLTYLIEVVGSGIGGLVAALLLVPVFDVLHLAYMLAFLNILISLIIVIRHVTGIKNLLFPAGMVLAGLCSMILIPVNAHIHDELWQGYQETQQYNSAFGRLTIARNPYSVSLFQNGVRTATSPDRESAEESVHYALLFHPRPVDVALAGGGLTGATGECFKHPSLRNLSYMESDPLVIELGRRYFQLPYKAPQPGDTLRIVQSDGRYHIKQRRNHYDVLIIQMPEPYTALINRYYTVEFYREARAALKEGGLLSFSISGSENYLSPSLRLLIQCLYKTLKEVFAHVYILPGSTLHFFASERPVDSFTADYLISEMGRRGLETEYIREYYLPFRFMPDRMAEIEEVTEDLSAVPVNSDLRPVAYFLSFMLWGSHFADWFEPNRVFEQARAMLFIIGLFLFLPVLMFLIMRSYLKQRSEGIAGAPAVLVMGLSVMAFELFIMLAFQAWYGYLYYQLSVLIAVFMIGMGGGSYFGRRKGGSEKRDLVVIHSVMAMIPVLLATAFHIRPEVFIWQAAGILFFVFLSLICGFSGGYQFAVASIYYHSDPSGEQSTGLLYGLDLIGGFIGALLLGSMMIPLIGFWLTAVVIAILNILMIALFYNRRFMITELQF